MKTRSINTKIWHDPWFEGLTSNEKLLFMYLISNEYVNLPGIYEVSEKRIINEIGLSNEQLARAKEALKEKVLFVNNWVIIKNTEKYDNYAGGKLLKAKDDQLQDIPEAIRDIASQYRDSVSIEYPYPMDTSNSNSSSSSNSIISRKEIVKRKPSLEDITQEFIRELALSYKVPIPFVLSKYEDLKSYCARSGRSYKDYREALRSFVKKDALKIVFDSQKGGKSYDAERALREMEGNSGEGNIHPHGQGVPSLETG